MHFPAYWTYCGLNLDILNALMFPTPYFGPSVTFLLTMLSAPVTFFYVKRHYNLFIFNNNNNNNNNSDPKMLKVWWKYVQYFSRYCVNNVHDAPTEVWRRHKKFTAPHRRRWDASQNNELSYSLTKHWWEPQRCFSAGVWVQRLGIWNRVAIFMALKQAGG